MGPQLCKAAGATMEQTRGLLPHPCKGRGRGAAKCALSTVHTPQPPLLLLLLLASRLAAGGAPSEVGHASKASLGLGGNLPGEGDLHGPAGTQVRQPKQSSKQ